VSPSRSSSPTSTWSTPGVTICSCLARGPRWSALPRPGRAVCRYTAGNPELTLFGGHFWARPRFLRTPGQGAEELLERSRALSGEAGGEAQGRLHAFRGHGRLGGVSGACGQGVVAERLILEGKVPAGLGMRLLGYAEACRAFRSGEKGARGGLYVSTWPMISAGI
jgi:hypothetical protein